MRTLFWSISLCCVLVFVTGNIQRRTTIRDTIKSYRSRTLFAKLQRGLQNKQKDDPDPFPDEVSAQCKFDLELASKSYAPWAERMRDAEGKPGSGVLDGHTSWIGSFDECRRVVASAKYNETVNGVTTLKERKFNAKYCRSYWYVDSPTPWSIGSCVSESCSRDEVTLLYNQNFTGEGALPVYYSYCGDEEGFEKDPSAIAASVILGIFGFIILFSTVYDIVVSQINSYKKKTNSVVIDMQNVANGGQIHMISKTPKLPINSGNMTGKDNLACTDVTVETNIDAKTHQLNGTSGGASLNETTGPEITPNLPSRERTKQSVWEKLLLSFSLKANLPKMLSTYQPKGSYSCMNGVRLFSMLWIILHHNHNLGQTITQTITLKNQYTYGYLWEPFSSAAVTNGQVGVESFFVLSGCLVAISFLKTTQKQGNNVKWRQMILFYVHRFFRLTPVYMLIIMMYGCFFRYIPFGPNKPEAIADAEYCRESWWTNLIYLNNFLKTDKTCLGHSWYLATDMQFFVISPIFLIPLALVPNAGLVVVGVLLAANFTIHTYMNYKSIVDNINFFQFVYNKPYTRIGPYLIGTILGYIMFRTNCKVRMNKFVVFIGWLVSFTLLFLTTYGVRWSHCDGCPPWNTATEVVYWTYMRSGFAVGLAWLIFACCTGYGGFINSFLSWDLFVPLSRLTFVAYLIHPILMYYYFYTRYTLFYVQLLPWIYNFLGVTTLALGISFAISICLEVPFLELDKILLPRK